MVVSMVLWDMGSAHKLTAKALPQIDRQNEEDFLDMSLFNIGFGGLHLCKCVVNTFRCFSISHDGQSFGIYILCGLRHGNDACAKELANVKNAVIEGKDRQSDLLCWLTCSPIVEVALELKKWYCVQRVPEPILHYKESAKTQKKVLHPVAVATNLNGDVFILDRSGCCLHVYDRGDVVKEYTVGKYLEQSSKGCIPYKKIIANDLMFSSQLESMDIKDDNVYIADGGKNQVIILRKCSLARQCLSRPVKFLDIDACVSLVCSESNDLICLCIVEGVQVIKALNVKFDKKTKL